MRIVERIKDAVEHTADSWQQKLLNEYNASDEPATRARKIISELVKQLDKPNQVIINDIVSLVYALASNPDPSIDLDQVVSTAEMLIHELVEPIPNPDKKLMDELLHLVVNASAHHKHPQMQSQIRGANGTMGAQNTNQQTTQNSGQNTQTPSTITAGQTQPGVTSQTNAPATQAPTTTAPKTASEPPKSAPTSSGKGVDNTMVKLIMDEMKEVIKKNQLTEQRITDVENRLVGRITAVSDDFQNIKDKIKKQEADLETINKNLDKFISLYEVVINQYNPFIEHVDEPKKSEGTALAAAQATIAQKAPPKADTKATKEATAIAAQANADSSEGDIHILIDKVKDMTDEAFVNSKEKTAKWITTVLKDQELATAFAQSTNKAQAVKLLLSKSLA